MERGRAVTAAQRRRPRRGGRPSRCRPAAPLRLATVDVEGSSREDAAELRI